MTEQSLTEHAIQNRKQWDVWADEYIDRGQRAWAQETPTWGMWNIPESEVNVLGASTDYEGKSVVELGCGTAYWSAWFARMGAKPTGIDNSPKQLETAALLKEKHQLTFPTILGTAESLPFENETFDIAFSEYGASIWCDPYLWIPEASRVLKTGGRLIFLVNGILLMACTPSDGSPTVETLQQDWFSMHRFEYPTDDAVEFHLPHGRMIDLLADCSLQVKRLVELQAPVGATTRYDFVTPEWAHRWPSEEIWVAEKIA